MSRLDSSGGVGLGDSAVWMQRMTEEFTSLFNFPAKIWPDDSNAASREAKENDQEKDKNV